MDENEVERQAEDRAERRCICEAPCECCEEQEEGEKVRERRVRSMPCILSLWRWELISTGFCQLGVRNGGSRTFLETDC